jgi:hypothetical protein
MRRVLPSWGQDCFGHLELRLPEMGGTFMQRTLVLLMSFFVAGSCLGCTASGAKRAAMVPNAVQLVNYHPCSVSAAVYGGSETIPIWTSEIGDAEFRQALEDAIRDSRLFSAVAPEGSGDYRLVVAIREVKQPMMGASMTVDVTADWQLMRGNDPQIIWRDTVKSTYTAKWNAHFVGYERLRLANEGAARANIEEGLRRVSSIRLDGAAIQLVDAGAAGGAPVLTK